ncbi:MAG: hypothetical protein ACE365_05980 [Gammaproteobacteria bacterium]
MHTSREELVSIIKDNISYFKFHIQHGGVSCMGGTLNPVELNALRNYVYASDFSRLSANTHAFYNPSFADYVYEMKTLLAFQEYKMKRRVAGKLVDSADKLDRSSTLYLIEDRLMHQDESVDVSAVFDVLDRYQHQKPEAGYALLEIFNRHEKIYNACFNLVGLGQLAKKCEELLRLKPQTARRMSTKEHPSVDIKSEDSEDSRVNIRNDLYQRIAFIASKIDAEKAYEFYPSLFDFPDRFESILQDDGICSNYDRVLEYNRLLLMLEMVNAILELPMLLEDQKTEYQGMLDDIAQVDLKDLKSGAFYRRIESLDDVQFATVKITAFEIFAVNGMRAHAQEILLAGKRHHQYGRAMLGFADQLQASVLEFLSAKDSSVKRDGESKEEEEFDEDDSLDIYDESGDYLVNTQSDRLQKANIVDFKNNVASRLKSFDGKECISHRKYSFWPDVLRPSTKREERWNNIEEFCNNSREKSETNGSANHPSSYDRVYDADDNDFLRDAILLYESDLEEDGQLRNSQDDTLSI